MKHLYATLLLAASAAGVYAQPAPPAPSPLELATIPGLSVDQQLALRKIFLQRRDAVESLQAKQHAEFEALRAKERSERERIEETTDASVRKLLGEDGYRKFAEWQLAQRPGPRGLGPPPLPPGPRNVPPRDGIAALPAPELRSQAAPDREGDE